MDVNPGILKTVKLSAEKPRIPPSRSCCESAAGVEPPIPGIDHQATFCPTASRNRSIKSSISRISKLMIRKTLYGKHPRAIPRSLLPASGWAADTRLERNDNER